MLAIARLLAPRNDNKETVSAPPSRTKTEFKFI